MCGAPTRRGQALLADRCADWLVGAWLANWLTALGAWLVDQLVGSYTYPHLWLQTTLWRGIGCDLLDQYKEGETIVWWSVSSCTADKKVAQNFANSCGASSTFVTVGC